MPSAPSTPRRPTPARRRGRPRASAATVRSTRVSAPATEPPPKRRRYIPGGPGGGGRFVEEDGTETPADGTASLSTSRIRASVAASTASVLGSAATPQSILGSAPSQTFPRRERSTRTRTATSRFEPDDEQFSSAAAITSAVIQSEGYKPREERGWEEFHPNLDIEATFMVFHAEDVDGTAKQKLAPGTPVAQNSPAQAVASASASVSGVPPGTPPKDQIDGALKGKQVAEFTPGANPDTPPTTRRRVGRPPRDPVAFYAARAAELAGTPKAPKVLPIHNQTPKERLDLKLPSYRKTDHIALFESKTFGQARYVDKGMMNVGYQESDHYIRPEQKLIKAIDVNPEDDADQSALAKSDRGSATQNNNSNTLGRVEYDMDEQDDMWLEKLNERRKEGGLETITREVFEITITKIEKEWHALEKRIPKPNPKPPQTHRPRSSSAAAVNGETQAGEEQDSKCAICDDGDCENTNAIVFCDGCDLAVHQECYGVPFIPEGQWLCRKCQLIGRGVPTCIFCPNTDGAFKQTNSSKWAHLLCSMWIPEVSLGNHTFMEPVMDVEKVPKTRWKLTCYICNQRMGACIQCGNKACYQAFHVTCARRARLYLKMKNSQGALAVLDGNMILKAFCDKHCPADYVKENAVTQATRAAKKFYKKSMKGRLWATSQHSAAELAATHRHAITEHLADESQITGDKVNAVMSATEGKKRGGGQAPKCFWRLPSGAPVIPLAVYNNVETALGRFTVSKRKDFVAEACRYWTLKREARRGAALLKRLQLQMETFTSMELTRRNFSSMGPSGKARLSRRIEFAKTLLGDMEQLKALSEDIVQRERDKLEEAELEQDFVDTCYFPVFKLLLPVIEKALALDKNVFQAGLMELQSKVEERYYTTTLAFAHDLCEVINVGINSESAVRKRLAKHLPASESQLRGCSADPSATVAAANAGRSSTSSPTKQRGELYAEARDRKRLGKRILKALQPQLETALRAEADIASKDYHKLVKELEGMLEASLEMRQATITVSSSQEEAEAEAEASASASGESREVIMVDAADAEITVADEEEGGGGDGDVAGDVEMQDPDEMDIDEDDERHATAANEGRGSNIEVDTSEIDNQPTTVGINGVASLARSISDQEGQASVSGLSNVDRSQSSMTNGVKPSDTPPADNGYVPSMQPEASSKQVQQQQQQQHQQQQQQQHQASSSASRQHHHQTHTSANTSAGPLTPPQSNGGLSAGGPPSYTDALTDGGVPWYLRGFSIEGTSAVEAQWTTGRDAVRSLSEELTDMDEEELNGLEFDVEDSTITASPPVNDGGVVVGNGSGNGNGNGSISNSNNNNGGAGGLGLGLGIGLGLGGETLAPPSSSAAAAARKRSGAAAGLGSGGSASSRLRKGVRVSSRRR